MRDWVMQLPLREQGAMLVATRGCDSAPKFPLESVERRLTAAIRYAVMVPHDEREVDAAPGCFMVSVPPMDLKLAMLEHYPMHWVMHVVHACEGLGYRHPVEAVANGWLVLYWRAVRSLHLEPESRDAYISRLGEDRVAQGTVVSL